MSTLRVSGNKQLGINTPEYDHVPLATLLLFCLYVLIWYLQIGVRIPALGALRIEFIWALLLTVLVISNTHLSFPHTSLNKYIGLLLLTMLVSLPFSCDVTLSWNRFFNRVVKFAFMGFFIASFVKSPRDLKFFVASFLLACGKLGQEGMHGQLTGSLVWQNQGVMRLHGPTPLYRHPNSFSGMALGTMPFVIYLWAVVGKYERLFLSALFVTSTTIILFTGSRTGYIAFFLMLGVIFVRSQNKVKFLSIALIIGFISLQYVPQQYKDRFLSSFTTYENQNTSAGKRVQILKDAVAIFIKHPLGVGVGAFPVMRQKTFGRIQDTHNLYLEVLTNIGVQGFVAFLLFVGKMLAMLRQLEHRIMGQLEQLQNLTHDESRQDIQQHRGDLKFMQAVGRAVFLFIWVRLGLGLFGMDMYEIYWWFASGLTIALWQMNRIAEQKTNFFIEEYTACVESAENLISPEMY